MNLDKLRDKLYDENTHIRKRLYVLTVFITLVAMFITILEVVFTDTSYLNTILLVVGFIFTIFLAVLSVKYNKIRLASIIESILMGFVYVPMTFFWGGGVYGDAPVWFLFSVLFMSMILAGKTKIFFLIAEAILAVVCYYLGFTHPEWILQNTDMMAHFYSLIALLLTGTAVSLMVGLEIKLYIRESIRSEKHKAEAEALNASQGRFFSSMSHEIRTPINTIIGLNEMILRENISDEVAEDAANIRSASKMLLSLINDILDMSKFESGSMQLNIAPYNPGDMLSELVGMLWLRAKDKKLEFHVNVAPDVPAELIGDEVRIKQILINVINNAIKYTKEGSVTLSVQCGHRVEDKQTIVYTVTDTGRGIKKEDIPYLFTAFKRVDEGDNQHIEGTGLGLAIVKSLVDLMGGTVKVNSVYMEGSTFSIEIPQGISGEKLIGEVDLEKKHSINRLIGYKQKFEAPEAKVLVVDDNASNLLVVSKLLRDTKVKIDTVSSGEAALKKTINSKYDVIFMDHLMPGMDGIECFKRIRNQVGGVSKEAKVIILTANADEESRQLYQKEGFDGYLTKPVTGAELESELMKALPSNLVFVTGDNGEILEETISWMNKSQSKKQVVITTESVADLPDEIRKKYDISVIPHKVVTKEGVFKDGVDIDTRGVLKYMQKPDNIVQPQAPEIEEVESFFADKMAYANNIVHISISSVIQHSGYPVTKEAAAAFENVSVVDSQHLSSGQGLMAIAACRMAEEGKSVQEILEGLEREKKLIHTSFIVDNLDFLARTKQVSQRIANITKSFMLRPVVVLKKGNMKVGRIHVGSREDAWKKYINEALRTPSRIDKRMLFVTYVGITKREMDWIREQIEKKVEFDEIFFLQASPAIAANCGPGTFGLLFREVERGKEF